MQLLLLILSFVLKLEKIDYISHIIIYYTKIDRNDGVNLFTSSKLKLKNREY